MAPFSILKLMYGPIFENSDTRESESRGICEKTGKFTDIKHSILGHWRNLRKKRGISRDSDTRAKKRGNSRKSNTRDSDTRGICEKNGGFHGIQTLESPKVEGFVKKRGNSRKSNTRDSGTRGICEKKRGISRDSDTQDSESRGFCGTTGNFMEFRESRFQKSVTPVRHSRSRKSRIFTFLKLMDGPYFL